MVILFFYIFEHLNLDGFYNFDDNLVVNEVLSLNALIEYHHASNQKNTEEVETNFTPMPEIIAVLETLKTFRFFFIFENALHLYVYNVNQKVIFLAILIRL